jgi:hypothetical protein
MEKGTNHEPPPYALSYGPVSRCSSKKLPAKADELRAVSHCRPPNVMKESMAEQWTGAATD